MKNSCSKLFNINKLWSSRIPPRIKWASLNEGSCLQSQVGALDLLKDLKILLQWQLRAQAGILEEELELHRSTTKGHRTSYRSVQDVVEHQRIRVIQRNSPQRVRREEYNLAKESSLTISSLPWKVDKMIKWEIVAYLRMSTNTTALSNSC